MSGASGEWLKSLHVSGQWRLAGGLADVPADALETFSGSQLVDAGAAFYLVTCDGERLFQSGLASDLVRWMVAIAIGVPDELVKLARDLPDDPSQMVSKAVAGLAYRPIVAVPSVASEFVRPDGTEWLVDDVDAVLGGASVSYSVHADGYQGVICHIKPRSRLIVNGSLRSYVVQSRSIVDGVMFWQSEKGCRSFRRSRLLETCDVKGVKAALKDLPEKPIDALPDFSLFRSAQRAAFAFNDWRRDDYRRVLSQVADVRLIVMPCATKYQVQRVDGGCWNGRHGSNAWALVAGFKSAHGLARWLHTQTLFDGWEAFAQALTGLPDDPSDGEWPDLPLRPKTP